jgi:magnesium transporter
LNESVFERAIASLDIVGLSLLLEALLIEERLTRWQQIPTELKTSVLAEMRDQAREPILDHMDDTAREQLLLQTVDAESLIGLADQLSEEWVERALGYLDAKQK